MESIHPQQLFPDVWLHCVQKCQRKGLLCTGMVLSRAGDIFGEGILWVPVDLWVAGDRAKPDLGPLTRCRDTAELPVARPPAAQNCHV